MVEEWSLDAHHHVNGTENHSEEKEDGKKADERSWAENLLDVHVVEGQVALGRNDGVNSHLIVSSINWMSCVGWAGDSSKDEHHKREGVCSSFHYCLTKE